ncbi:MAG: hypothetical protein A2845_00620 [Candidatus Lloydbacteria bacterium RIFCSPHIGHO2_01_FULL_49_22]|uniref:Uncharacterized protein n=1 Tax=Candidatus Lloydbacteria bacterium RIFCSPHIGHO2_01_FULL_49_22 TaxID=1798658 RepID=A0A1G2CY36_9BACT|nr:MAG: hypothetical protein A2845_00620 [Candidatus Lloydbacteria bacterium RIFCSPHIGHO2_01_FULL_49_22]OGZ09366.1 MAG: hypothetical protein A3C14_05525 [Candidatus Lloydbacteria bacterium RIFCSPHIGHO2_02_FULL_50_18]
MTEALPSCRDMLCDAFVREFDELPTDSIWLVSKIGSEFALSSATSIAFKEWLRQHQGFFSKFPRRYCDWKRSDVLRSSKIISAYRSTFYVYILPDELKTFPES